MNESSHQTSCAWPQWKDTLYGGACDRPRIEGGLRMQGFFKSSTPSLPLITYITVVKNGGATIARALISVQRQKYANIEHIVLDGASTDNTLEIIQEYSQSIDYYASEADSGLYHALNKAIELARGDLICVLNADDWLTPDAAQVAADFFVSHDTGAVLLLTAAWVVKGKNQEIWLPAHVDIGSYLSCANACHNAMYASRSAYESSGPYALHLSIAADFLWVMRCIDQSVKFFYSNHPTTYYSLGGLSSNVTQHSLESVQIITSRFPCLTHEEAWGLYHCLHTFKERKMHFQSSAPSHKGRFLRDLSRRYATESDLLRAVALASLAIMQHPQDDQPPGKLSRKEKTRRSIHKRTQMLRSFLHRIWH
ncbi:glycosyltransferase family 2 protein [Aquabacterium sp.]|uniref:glycosyltransferase family 2 protein n=1 Tax=Aquabacterium sp. TaxID=1872578 RepID=UPI0024876C68|nr:glycosyltransferase family 2 protein [Aquabacterium sp.]MDI1347829.1 glycosyltransferase family 2 protein [Aquabacterium sp.]